MKTIASTLCAIALASFATLGTAQETAQPGFTVADDANPVCKYVRKADRRRDLECLD
jgi:predicted pyridoxine 5'-phosphate oxidase superfamily flavin-nucleotide-binding protein